MNAKRGVVDGLARSLARCPLKVVEPPGLAFAVPSGTTWVSHNCWSSMTEWK
ncbi:MAG TPA: hypothetical protein VF940_20450 [Streptosporangiaceae bacterium]